MEKTQKTAWGPKHLLSATPRWASKIVSCMATLIGVWPVVVAAYPHLIPVDVQLGGAKVIGAVTLFFQMFGIKCAPDAGVIAETDKLTTGVSEDQVRAMILELMGGKDSPAGDEAAEPGAEQPKSPNPVPGVNVVIGPLPPRVDSNELM